MLSKVIHNGEEWDYYVDELGKVYNAKMHELQLRTNNSGYAIVDLYKNKKSHTITVHRIVAETFIPQTGTSETVNHINGDKLDNRIENLEWSTYSDNNKHAYDTGLKQSLKGEKSPFAKVDEATVRKICAMLEYEKSPTKVANAIGCDRQLVIMIKCGYAWTSVSKDYNMIKPGFVFTEEIEAKIVELHKLGKDVLTILDEIGWPRKRLYARRVQKIIERNDQMPND